MAFTLLPAIDVAGARLGLYTAEGPRPHDAFGGDPILAAQAYVAAGARWLHVVDMDLAFGGEPRNVEVVAAIRDALPDVSLQVSGGIRTAAQAEVYLDAGADRFVVASAALTDERAIAEMLGSQARRLIVGIEVAEGRVRARGRADLDLDLMTTLGWLTEAGAPSFLITDIGRVGTMQGPDLALLRRARRAGRSVLVAGGISSLADLRAVHAAGGEGAVVGRSALEETLSLADALVWAAQP